MILHSLRRMDWMTWPVLVLGLVILLVIAIARVESARAQTRTNPRIVAVTMEADHMFFVTESGDIYRKQVLSYAFTTDARGVTRMSRTPEQPGKQFASELIGNIWWRPRDTVDREH